MQNKSENYPEPSQMPKLFPYYWEAKPWAFFVDIWAGGMGCSGWWVVGCW